MTETTKAPPGMGPGQAARENYLNRHYTTPTEQNQDPPQTSNATADAPPPPSRAEKRRTDYVRRRLEKMRTALSEADNMIHDGATASDILSMLSNKTTEQKPLLRQADLEEHLSEIGVEACYDVISHEISFPGADRVWPKLDVGEHLSKIPIKLRDQLYDNFKKAGANEICDLLGLIAAEHSVNPVLDLITTEPWDGVRRFHTIVRALHLESDNLSKTLIGKWMLQGIALLHSSIPQNYSPDGALVLQGKQGIGKTSFGRVLSIRPEWFKDGGRLNRYDKDLIVQLTAYFIAELGEVESTIRATDVELLKEFITSGRDEYRLPYERTGTKQPRRTNIFATCNSVDFLVDPTGNRRFWTVPLPNGIDLPALEKLDALQLWREYYQYWKKEEAAGRGGVCYRLTAEERAALEERNAQHRAAVPGQSEVEAILADAAEHPELYQYKPANVSDWMETFPIFDTRHLSSNTVGKALTACGIERKSYRQGSKTFKGYVLPFRV